MHRRALVRSRIADGRPMASAAMKRPSQATLPGTPAAAPSSEKRKETQMNARTKLALFSAAASLALALSAPARADAPPSPWISEDIGQPAKAGSTQVDATGAWTIQSGGSSSPYIGGTHLTYQRLQGDGSITARLLSGMPDGEAGGLLTVRGDDTLDAAAVNYGALLYGTYAGAIFQRGAPVSKFMNGGPYNNTAGPVFLRLQRVGNGIGGFYSTDGALWSADFDPASLPDLAGDALFGLAVGNVGGANQKQLYTAEFDQVQVQAGAALVTSLRACAGDQKVALQGDPLPQAIGYDLYRGPAGARADQLVKLNTERVTGTTYSDNSDGLLDGIQVTYGVAAVFTGADGAPVEGPVEVLPAEPGTAPSGYLGCSLLEGPVSGSAAYDPTSNGITLQGSGIGVGINGYSMDGCYFLNQALDGDQQITVRMPSQPSGGQAGLMIRESLQVGARQLTLGIDTGSAFGVFSPQGLATEWRPGTYQPDKFQTLVPLKKLSVPIVLRLTRRGNTITPAYSTDNDQSFTAGETVTFDPPLPSSLYYGLEATAERLGLGSRDSLNTAQFEAPTVQPTVQPVSGP